MADEPFHVPPSVGSTELLLTLDEYSRERTSFEANDDVAVLKASDGLGWTDVYAVISEEQPHIAVRRAIPAFRFTATLKDWALHRIIDGCEYRATEPSHLITITVPGNQALYVVETPTTVLHVFLKEEIVKEVADELLPDHRPDLAAGSSFAIDDPALMLLLRTIRHSLDDPPHCSALKMGYISRALAAHLLHSPLENSALRPEINHWKRQHGLSARQMRLVQEYIEENLGHELSINDLSTLIGLSRVQFIRRFKVSTRMTPHQYVIEARVRKARQLLAEGLHELADIAIICGFASQTHFCSTFKRFIGMTPAAYRRMIA